VRTYDVERERRDLYAPGSGDFAIVEVPPMQFLVVDGRGDPDTSAPYREAVTGLFSLSDAVRAVTRSRRGRVPAVGPLGGLWSAADLDVYRTRDRDAWQWTLMIARPDWVSADLVGEARAAAERGRLAALDRVRFECHTEGRSVQILHIGSYDDEARTLRRLHEEFLPAHGLVATGRHHEIYLSDARRTEPARLRTVLRRPVGPSGR